MMFLVDPRKNGGDHFRVHGQPGLLGDPHVVAANRAARRILNTRSLKVIARRETGEPGSSGLFQAYRSDPLHGLVAQGYLFHLRLVQ